MTGDYRVEYGYPYKDRTEHSTIRDATLAFGRALNDHRHVRLTSIGLVDHVLAEYFNDEPETGRHHPCPVCGRSHPSEQHGYDTTASRLLLAHDNHNHAQCHPKAQCKGSREEERDAEDESAGARRPE